MFELMYVSSYFIKVHNFSPRLMKSNKNNVIMHMKLGKTTTNPIFQPLKHIFGKSWRNLECSVLKLRITDNILF